MPIGNCASCGVKDVQVLGNPKECKPCRDKKRAAQAQVDIVVLSEPELAKRVAGDLTNLHKSLFFLKEQKIPAFYISTMTAESRGFGALANEDTKWKLDVVNVVQTHFMCKVSDVFAGLVFFAGNAMVFTGPGASEHGSEIQSPSVSIMPLQRWNAVVGAGDINDWICVACHEIIHYLHWRWGIIPCDPQHVSDYEDQVSGQLEPGKCPIPNFAAREDNGVLELVNPAKPLTENAYRLKLGLEKRKSYNDITVFAKKK